MADESRSLQDTYAPRGVCFGCGPANTSGLRIKSRPAGDEVTATWSPEKHHEAFEGVLSGGIIGTLLDCHSNWTAAAALMRSTGSGTPPCTVTAEYHVRLLRPTAATAPVRLRARAVEVGDQRAVVEATLESKGKIAATCRGVWPLHTTK